MILFCYKPQAPLLALFFRNYSLPSGHPERSEGSPTRGSIRNPEIPHYVRDDLISGRTITFFQIKPSLLIWVRMSGTKLIGHVVALLCATYKTFFNHTCVFPGARPFTTICKQRQFALFWLAISLTLEKDIS